MLKFRCKQALSRNTSYFPNNGPRGLHTCPTNGWVFLCGDFNAYTIDHVGFTEKESEFHDTLPDECDWPIRRKSASTHPRRNQNGRELIALCQSCELVVVNGALVDGKFFDSGWTRDSNRVEGGSVIDYVLASPRIFPRLVSLRISNPG